MVARRPAARATARQLAPRDAGREDAAVILECASLDVRAGQAEAFEHAFGEAQPLIRRQPGFVSLRLERCIERPGRYLLLVEWETLTAHTEGFRRSPDYRRWRELLHHFYDPFPVVEHFEPVTAR